MNIADRIGGLLSSGLGLSPETIAALTGNDLTDILAYLERGTTPPDPPPPEASVANLLGAVRAAAFVESLLEPLIDGQVVSRCEIEPDAEWPPSYTGKVTGRFSLVDLDPATEQLCPLVVSNPGVSELADDYRGTVYGNITLTPVGSYTAYKVQAYKETDAEYAMASSVAVDAANNFALDLSTTPAWELGTWRLGLLDASNNLVGQLWPQPRSYSAIQVQSLAITDAVYPLATKPADVTQEFYFPSISAGRKSFRLIRTSDNAVLAHHTPGTGNVRSYLVKSGEPGYGTNFVQQSYSYDQAMCLLAAVALRNRDLARELVRGLLALQTTGGGNDGGFIFSGQQLSPSYGDAAYRTGAHAICTYALLGYIEAWPSDVSYTYVAAAERALTWLDTQLVGSGSQRGLYRGGTGLYSGTPQVFNQGYQLTWASTEHNIDVWQALTKAASVLGNSSYATAAAALAQAIMGTLWDATHRRFLQGFDATAGPDTADPLDAHTWGAIFLNNAGYVEDARAVMSDEALAPFKLTQGDVSGYAPFYAAGGYANAVPSIWSEGTFGAALAFRAIGENAKSQKTLAGMMPAQQPDGGFHYVSVYDPTYQLTTSEASVAAAWMILAVLGHGIWGL